MHLPSCAHHAPRVLPPFWTAPAGAVEQDLSGFRLDSSRDLSRAAPAAAAPRASTELPKLAAAPAAAAAAAAVHPHPVEPSRRSSDAPTISPMTTASEEDAGAAAPGSAAPAAEQHQQQDVEALKQVCGGVLQRA